MLIFEILKAIILGIVEGITEWLPVSSTGHMILVDEFLKLNVSEEFMDMFLVVIQLGAILSVVVLFWNRLNFISQSKSNEEKRNVIELWIKIIVGALPAGIVGVGVEILLDDYLDKYLYNYIVVAIALIIYGILFIIIENRNEKKNLPLRADSVEAITYIDALKIGSFQILALIPGTSRSGSTMIGGLVSGVSRVATSEFSFFMAIPIMLGASALKLLKFILGGYILTTNELLVLMVGLTVSFVISLFSINFLLEFVRNHSFKPFGIYRIVLGVVIVAYFLIKTFA